MKGITQELTKRDRLVLNAFAGKLQLGRRAFYWTSIPLFLNLTKVLNVCKCFANPVEGYISPLLNGRFDSTVNHQLGESPCDYLDPVASGLLKYSLDV